MTAASATDLLFVARAGRVRIRRRVVADAIDEYRWERDPEIARHNGLPPATRSFTDFLNEFEHELRIVDSTRETFAIETHAGEHIGSVSFYHGNHAESAAEIGMTIGEPSQQSAGYGREAAIAFLRYLFAERPFSRIRMHALEWNERAIRCFAAIGFAEGGRVLRGTNVMVRMDVSREWWLLWDQEGRFERYLKQPGGS